MYSSGFFFIIRIKETRSLISKDFVDISKLDKENLSSVKEFRGICVVTDSIPNTLSLYFRLGPKVLAFILSLKGSRVILSWFISISKFLFILLILVLI